MLTFVAGALVGIVGGGMAASAVLVMHPAFASRLAHAAHRLAGGGAAAAGNPAPDVAGVVVTLDAGASGHAISPLIYGVAAAGPSDIRTLGASLDRWGGNPSSRFNWANGHAWNAARDWEFRNTNYAQPSQASQTDAFYADAASASATALMTIPTLGWVAVNDDNATRSTGVPGNGGAAINGAGAIAGYDPTANREKTSVQSAAHKPGPFVDAPDPHSPVVYEDEFVHHVVAHYPNAASGYFAMDNEPDLWSFTHTDVHPAQMGYDDMLANYVEYATAVRAQAPNAHLLGPDVSGWTSYFFSAKDRGSDNFATHADQSAHGGQAFLPWWLAQVAAHDKKTGVRTLDLVDVHYYAQASGVYSSNADPQTQALRIRSTRSLWDPSYTDESWINDKVELIPRLKGWIAADYPGLGIAISEYGFGGEGDQSGAAAEAETLGIFGREGVNLASYWTYPKLGSPVAAAFEMYRNYDGKGGQFGDVSIPVRSTSEGVAAFAARHSQTGEIDVVLVNESVTATGTASLAGLPSGALSAELFQTSGSTGKIQATPLASPGASLTLPPMSVSLVKVVKG